RFILQDAGASTYYLYFDVVANGPKAANPQAPINGNFERGAAGTQNPAGWTATKTNANFDAQVRPGESPSIATDAGGTPSPVTTDGTPFTGSFSYLVGARTNNEAANGAPAVTLSRTIAVPAASPGNIVVRYRPEGWDSSDNAATQWDFLRIRLVGATTTEIVGPTAGNYVTYPFAPNKGTGQIANNRSGYGRYNYWDMDTNGNHRSGMTLAAGSQPWFTRTFSLATYAGQTITLQITSTHATSYKSWTHIDDVEWSVVAAGLGAPQANLPSLPGGFNAYETTTPAGAITGVIKTKVAGSVFNLDLVALNTAKTAILTTFTGAVKVELLNASNNSGVLDASGCRSTWTVIQTLSTNPVFVAGDNGRKTAAFTENNAWQDVRVRISYPATGMPTAIGCSTDNFAIRPSVFANFTITDSDWQTAGTGRTLNNTAAPGGNVHKAGRPFTLRADAMNAQATPAVTNNYTGTPATALSACVGTGCTSSFGVFTAGSAAVAGQINSTTASYSETGSFSLQLVDQTFASVDASDSTTAERYVTSATISVGRFVPDHFSLQAGSIFTPACTTGGSRLTYMGQPFAQVKYTLTAENASNAVTANYTAAGYAPGAVGIVAENADNGVNLGSRVTGGPAVSWASGQYAVNTSAAAFGRNTAPATPDGPYDSLQLGLQIVDADGVALTGADMNPVSSGSCLPASCTAVALGLTGSVRFGRARLSNASGSALLDLPVGLALQYWNAASGGFVSNTTDTCTALTASDVALTFGGAGNNLSACETAVSMAGGSPAALKLLKPGAGNNGWVDLRLNLGAAASGNTCTGIGAGPGPAATTANRPWLQGAWTSATYNQDPTARATFDIYKNANEFIFMRENY
ncbi:MAG: hypothetical protein C0522_08995, partial [Rhodocyclaceae bacterium]|nr:hypothetical protein [Rhodocyclaceae bacterium]